LMVHARSSWGGNTAMVLALSQGLIAKGFRVELAAHPGQPYIEPFQQVGITVHEIGIGGKGDFLAPIKLANLIKKRNINIVHSHTRPADLAAVFAGILTHKPTVITQHGNINLDRKTLKRRHNVFSFGYNLVLRKATRIAAVCEATQIELTRFCHVSPENIRVIYNGIADKACSEGRSRENIRTELGIAPDVIIGLITGAIHWKGHDVLAQVVAKLRMEFPNVIVLAAGTGPREAELREQISRLAIGDHFRMLGFRKDIPDLLAAADLFILPSQSEAFPVSILEAMRAGLPIVASNIGGIPEQVEDGISGLLVNPGSVDELADALGRLIANSELRRRMGENGRMKAREFTLERMVDGYISLYDQVLGIR